MRICFLLVTTLAATAADYFPPPDAEGGWRTIAAPAEIRRRTGLDTKLLEETFEYIQGSSANGGLLVARRGWLVYERYFGLGHREATPNTASCGKSFTSVAVGILLDERRDLFPDGLDQKVFDPRYLPPEAFPLSDPRKAAIKLGQLLAMTAGIRGNNPGYVRGKPVTLEPAGPDGWRAMVDAVALGKQADPLNTVTLWCQPGEGYSYATSSIHIASMVLRHVTRMELQEFVARRIANPLGWGRWGWGYRRAEITHTPGGGGIALRATDMLRFAYLLLREGRWKAKQVVPAEYVHRCERASPYNPHYPYGLQFDVNTDGHVEGVPRDAFWKSGSGGHCVYVVPSLDLVAWKMGGRDEQYSPANTGLPESPAAGPAVGRQDWKPKVAHEEAVKATLQMLVRAAGWRAK